jgi:hypothetical protein
MKGTGQYSLLKHFFNHEPHEQTRKFRMGAVALTNEMACGFAVWFVVSPIAWRPWRPWRLFPRH